MKALLVYLFMVSGIGIAYGQSPTAEDSARCRFEPDSMMKRVLCRKPDKGAEFKGGSYAFNDMMNQRFHYDRALIDHQFILIFVFVVESDGNISGVTLQRSNPDLPSSILKGLMTFFKQMPRRSYQPAVCGNQPVASRVTQPVILVP